METNGETDAVRLRDEEALGSGQTDSNAGQEHDGDTDRPDFGPLVIKLALGIARELAGAIRELENHLSIETRRAGEATEGRLNTIMNEVANFSQFIGEQRSANGVLHEKMQHLVVSEGELREARDRYTQELETLRADSREFSGAVSAHLDAAMAALEESNAGHTRQREALHNEVRSSFPPVWERIDNLCRDIGARQEDIAVTKTALDTISSRIDACVERLDRQAEAVRSVHGASRQRDIELEQIVEGLVRLKASPRPDLADGL